MGFKCAAAATLLALTMFVPSAAFGQSTSPNLGRALLSPVANAGPNQTVKLGNTVLLNGGGSSNPGNAGRLTYSWSLTSAPAGSNAVLSNAGSVTPSFVADVDGDYLVSLTVGNGSAFATAKVAVSTINSPPTANAGPNQTAAVGSTVTLDGSGSNDPDGNPISYSWSLVSAPANSSASSLEDYTSVSPKFVADQAGTYILELVVSDGKVSSVPSRVTITTGNTPPVASAGVDQHVAPGAVVQLDGSGSSDANGDALSYRWSIVSSPENSMAVLSNATAVTPTLSATVPGTYVAQLVVNDGTSDGLPATVVITTSATLAPVANAGTSQTAAIGTDVMLNGSGTDPQGLPVTLKWNFVSVPAGSAARLSNRSGAHPTFVPDVAGTYIAQLIAANEFIGSVPSTVTITTSNTPPAAHPGRLGSAGAVAAAVSPTITVTNATIGHNLQGLITIGLNPPPPANGLSVTIASSDPTKALVGNSRPAFTVTITPGENTFTMAVEALASAGTATVRVSAPGYAPAVSTITFARSGFVIAASNGVGGAFTAFEGTSTPLTISAGFLNASGNFVKSQAVRPGVSVSVPVSSSVGTVGTILGSPLVFGGGMAHATATFRASSTNLGDTGVSVGTPPGFTPANGNTLEATVAKAGLIAFRATVGQRLEQLQTISLSAPAPTNVQVTLTSKDPIRLKFATTATQLGVASITLTIPVNHATSPTFFVQALANSGSAGYTASAGTFGTINGSVAFAPSGLGIQSPGGFNANFTETTTEPAATLKVVTGFLDVNGRFVRQQPVRAGASVPVTVTSSNTSTGVITASPITIGAGVGSALTGFQPRAVGTAVVTASSPGLRSAQVTATVINTPLPLLFTGGDGSIGKNLESQFTVNLPRQAGPGGVAVTIHSNSGVLFLAPNATAAGTPQIVITVPANQTSAPFYAQVTSDAGSASFTATASGFKPTTGTVALVPAGVFLSPLSVSGNAGGTITTLSVNTGALDPNNSNSIINQQKLAGGRPALTVPLSSNQSGIASVPASVSIQPGTISQSVPVQLGSPGSAFISVSQPPGFTPPSLGGTTTVTVNP